MTETPNPYQPAAKPSNRESATSDEDASLSKLMATIIGLFVATLLAVVVGEVLSVIALFPPMNHWFDLDDEFAGLILIAIPVLAGTCGAVAGLVLGLAHPKSWCRWVSITFGSLPAFFYCWASYSSPEGFVSLAAITGIMILAMVSSVWLTHRVLTSIARRRSSCTAAMNTPEPDSSGVVVLVIAIALALLSGVVDVWLWRTLASSDGYGHSFSVIGAFCLGMLAVTTNLCVWAAQPHHKRIAIVAGSLSFLGGASVLSFWYLRLIQ